MMEGPRTMPSPKAEPPPESARPVELKKKAKEEPIPLVQRKEEPDETLIPLSTRDFEPESVEPESDETALVSISGERLVKRDRAEQAVENLIPHMGSFQEYQPKFLGKGGEHIVVDFDDPKHKDVVYKANFYKSMPGFLAAVQHSESPEQAEAKMNVAVQRMRESKAQRELDIKQLRKYFGKDAVPGERQMIRDVPFSMDIVRAIDPTLVKKVRKIPETIPALVSVQKRVDLPKDSTVLLKGDYPERRILELSEEGEDAKGIYDQSHLLLTGQEAVEKDPQQQRELVLKMYPQLEAVVEQAAKDPSFNAKLKDTVKRMFAFSRETEMALDFVGSGNIALTKEDDTWKMKMPDALMPDGSSLRSLEIATQKMAHGLSMSPFDVNAALNALNSLKMMNALAVLADVPDRLRATEIDRVPPQAWRSMMANALYPDRAQELAA